MWPRDAMGAEQVQQQEEGDGYDRQHGKEPAPFVAAARAQSCEERDNQGKPDYGPHERYKYADMRQRTREINVQAETCAASLKDEGVKPILKVPHNHRGEDDQCQQRRHVGAGCEKQPPIAWLGKEK